MANFPRDELIWASGLFEGEGCISTTATNRGSQKRYPRLQVVTTDREVLERFHAAVGGLGNLYTRGQSTYWRAKGQVGPDQYSWQLTGFHKCQAVLAMLWGGLSSRRRARAKEVMLYG